MPTLSEAQTRIGNGLYVWQMHAIDPDPKKGVAKIKDVLHPDSVSIKSTEGPYVYQPNKAFGLNVTPAIVNEFRQSGIAVSTWGFNYGKYPAREGQVAAEKANELHPDFHVLDVENQFEATSFARLMQAISTLSSGPEAIRANFEALAAPLDAASTLVSEFRNNSDTPLVFCGFGWVWSFKNKSPWHNPNLHSTFLSQTDGGNPMAYALTNDSAGAAAQVTESARQWNSLNPNNVPLIIGTRAFNGEGVTASKVLESSHAAALEMHQNDNVIGTLAWHAATLLHPAGKDILAAWNRLPPWPDSTAPPKPEQHADSLPDYANSISGWAVEANQQELLLEKIVELDRALRSSGYSGPLPPESIQRTLASVMSFTVESYTATGTIEVPAEAWHTALTRRVFAAASYLTGSTRK